MRSCAVSYFKVKNPKNYKKEKKLRTRAGEQTSSKRLSVFPSNLSVSDNIRVADSWSHLRVGNVGLFGSLNLCLIIVSGVLANHVRYNMCFSSVLERRHLKSEIFDCKHIFH